MWRAKVARVAKRVTLQNQETKLYEYVGVNTTPGGSLGLIPLYSNGGATSGSNAPYVDLPLDNIDQGVTESTRVGNDIVLKGMHIRATLENEVTAVANTQVRIILAWVDPNFTPSFTAANVLYLPAAAGNNVITAQIKGPTHQDSIMRKVVMDRTFMVRPGNIVSGGSATQQIMNTMVKMNIPLHNKKYQFISGTAGIGGEKEDLVMFVFAFAPSYVNTQPVVNMRFTNRIYYKDG